MSAVRVGFIGLGNMGMAMAKCIPEKGFTVTVYDLVKEAVDKMVALGAKPANSCREVAEASDVVFTMVRDIDQTNEVIFGKDGIWEGLKEGGIIVISSSIGPKYCQDLYVRAKEEKGIKVVDCAVSDPSGPIHYWKCRLNLLIGGDDEDVKKCWPIFETMGERLFHLGKTGMGQAYKLVNNMAALHVPAVARECLGLGRKLGLDEDKLVEVMSVSTGGTWGLQSQVRIKELGIEMPRMGPPPGQEGIPRERRVPFEVKMAWELAGEVGVEMPVCRFIDSHNLVGL
jgi:3-hydroxyisobutyrate dehydrogenase-like beta-hydroxyacid dehydrogenase